MATQGATRDSATCDPVPGVQAQGTLGSGATCPNPTTSDDLGDWRSEPSRHFAAMTQPTSHMEKRRVAHKATKDAVRGKHGTLNPAAAAAGRSSTDDRMDVAQSSSLKRTPLTPVLPARCLRMRTHSTSLLLRRWELRLDRHRPAQPESLPAVQQPGLSAKLRVDQHLRQRKRNPNVTITWAHIQTGPRRGLIVGGYDKISSLYNTGPYPC